MIRSALLVLGLCIPVSASAANGHEEAPASLAVEQSDTAQRIALGGTTLRVTEAEVGLLRSFAIDDLLVALWNETVADGSVTPWYAISHDGGASFAPVTATSYTIGTVHGGAFDPRERLPGFFASSPLAGATSLYMVQYQTQALAEYQERVRAAGGNIQTHFVNHTNLVRLSSAAAAEVAAMEFVRAVVPYHQEYRLEGWLLDRLGSGEIAGTNPYNIWVFDRSGDQAALVAKIEALGGDVRDWSPRSSLVGALLDEAQLLAMIGMDEVQYVDRYSELAPDNDIVRQFTGTDALEVATGWSGQGVAGEVADNAIHETHLDFQHDGGILMHGGESGSSTSHGTQVHGIVFGDGTANPQWRGVLPRGSQIFADSDSFGWLNNTNPTNRATHTAELVDPTGPYKGVFQTNSQGSNQVTAYTTISANMDQIVLDNDLVISQSQSNLGNQLSRPEAWGKNMISVGGISHEDTLTKADDNWDDASIGPAEDGRIKPDLAHFYDWVTAPSNASNSSYDDFFGTSAATPCTTAHFGLFFQMWHNDVWHNAPTGTTPFESKPHYETAQAAMINTAIPRSFTGTTHNLTRVHQGFGAVNVDNLYQLRDRTVWRDREVISNLETKSYAVDVAPGEERFKATLVYRDLPGNPGFLPHRINDISLKVISPLGTVYFGNNGLTEGNVSTPDGSANAVDTKENVWVNAPTPGAWTVEIPRRGHQHRPLPGVRRQQRRLLALDHGRHRWQLLELAAHQLLHRRDLRQRLRRHDLRQRNGQRERSFGFRRDGVGRRRRQEGSLLLRQERPPGDPLGQRHELPVRRAARGSRRRVAWHRHGGSLRRLFFTGSQRALVPDLLEAEPQPGIRCHGSGAVLVPRPALDLQPDHEPLRRDRVLRRSVTVGSLFPGAPRRHRWGIPEVLLTLADALQG